MQPNKRRLAAVSFLSNISLDGTYKDVGNRTLELVKDAILHSQNGMGPGPGDNMDQRVLLQHDIENCPPELVHVVNGFGGKDSSHVNVSRTCSRVGSISADEEIFTDAQSIARKRMNTTGSEAGVIAFHRRLDSALMTNYNGSKRSHFSSNESIENVGNLKGSFLSGTNISESSLEQPREIKLVNMSDVNPSKLDITYERLVILVSHRTPWYIYSVLPYQGQRNSRLLNRIAERPEVIRRVRNISGSRPVLTHLDPDPLEQLFHVDSEEVSYASLIHPTLETEPDTDEEVCLMKQPLTYAVSRCFSAENGSIPYLGYLGNNSTPPEINGEFSESNQRYREQMKAIGNKYSAHILDDSEFLAGKHRTLLTFSSYVTSVIEYCKPSDLKKELNDKFRDRFPAIQLTLSKLRSLKREMRKVAKAECNIDLLVVAQAYVYFEKLILKSYVTKSNRKFCSGACLLLSAKLNDVKGQNLYNLIEVIERSFRVNREELFKYEFAVLIALEFSLHIPTWEVLPHYQRLLYES